MREAPSPAERGQAIVEFALVIPVLFLMLVGVVHFAMAMYLQQVLNDATYAAARSWTRNPTGGLQCAAPCTDAELNYFKLILEPRVKKYVADSGFSGPVTVTSQRTFDSITVSVSYPYSSPVGSFGAVTLSASNTFKRE